MRILHTIMTILWLFVVVIACNTNPSEPAENSDEDLMSQSDEHMTKDTEASSTDKETDDATTQTEKSTATLDKAVDQPVESESTVGEVFPEGNGYKGVYEEYVFYIEMEGEKIKGFVRHKDENSENPITGKMSSPFNFDAEEISEDEAGDELKMASIRGSMNSGTIDIDYSDANSAKSFRVTLKQ